ncbi:STAS domain-containing protein [Actinomadura rubrisoli]|uniref:Anti-sigma factor antagonist n=1 Tax=Actinomadura rubrisoli TaxID=2530368 RepID=A0A4R5BDN9_9ACTN|nr:STAS domain-containing protein [Actinomadura rubrisoli]TDD83389.1 anti-sigma factor antagonist [Actinomadura rubrisoli]
MTVWRISGGEGEPGADVPRPDRAAPRYDLVEVDTALLRVAGGTGSPWLRVSGDVDVSNAVELTRALHAAEERAAGDVHVDLSQIAFIDVAGLRAITQAARVLRESGHLLVLHSVSTHIDKLFRLIGWDATPGLLVHCRTRAR